MVRSIHVLKFITVVTLLSIIGCSSGQESAQEDTKVAQESLGPQHKPTVVLVHGAWADALGWQDVIGRLQHDGYLVRSIEIPLSSFALDVETTQRALAAAGEAGPLIVAAHSFGGAVVTEAAAGNSSVKALVYINAFAPDVGETLLDLAGKFPRTPVFEAFVPDSAGFVTIDPNAFQSVFCADVSDRQSAILAAAQKPLSVSSFSVPLKAAAWRTLPTWYLVGRQDHTVHPDLERFVAKRMNAHVTEIDSSHVPFISHPGIVVRMIEQAAATTVR